MKLSGTEEEVMQGLADIISRLATDLSDAEREIRSLKLKLDAQRFVGMKLIVAGLGKRCGLTIDDWQESIDDAADYMERHADASPPTADAYREFASEIRAWREINTRTHEPIFTVIEGGKSDPQK